MVLPEDLQAIWFDGVTACAADVEFNITTTDGQRHKNLWEDCEKDEVMLMQYTGLKDKNGVEIYEGDILEFTDKWEWYRGNYSVKMMSADQDELKVLKAQYEAEPMYRYKVKYHPYDGYGISKYDLENYLAVVGNIYQNPELLSWNP